MIPLTARPRARMIIRTIAAAAVAASAFGIADAAPAEIDVRARLHGCGAAACLLIAGQRDDAAAPVAIAGHDVPVRGGRRWRVSLPLDTVRDWSAPAARSIAVRVGGPSGRDGSARLPIGLLGHVTQLAFVDVRAR